MQNVTQRYALTALAVATLISVGAAGCAAGTDAGDMPSASATTLECPKTPVDPVSAEAAASCVYRGWLQNDQTLASAYGRAGILDDLPTVMADPKMTFAGCDEGGSKTTAGLTCIWNGTDQNGPVSIEMAMTGSVTDGYRVSATTTVHS